MRPPRPEQDVPLPLSRLLRLSLVLPLLALFWAGPFGATAAAVDVRLPTDGDAVAPPAPTEPEPPPTLDLFYTGFTGGLASARLDFGEVMPLYRPDATRDFEVGGLSADNVFRHGPFLLYTDAGPLTLDDFRAFFAAGPVEIAREATVPLIESDYAYTFVPGTAPDGGAWLMTWLADRLARGGGFSDAHRAEAVRFGLTSATGLRLSVLSLNGEAPPLEVLEAPTRWEMLSAGALAVRRGPERTPLLAVGRPLGDGLRRSRLLADWRRELGRPALAVDLGNLIDPGFSELSREQRRFTLRELGALGYDALVPGASELSLAPDEWARLAERVPLLAANLAPRDPSRPPLAGTLVKSISGLKIGLVGVVDDRELLRQGATGPQSDWTAGDPLAAARTAVDALAPEGCDAVVILTNVRDERLQALRDVNGASAVLADFQGLPGDVYTESVTLTGPPHLRVQTSYLVAHASPNRVGHLQITFDAAPRTGTERRAPTGLMNQARLVTDDLPQDEAWRYQLNTLANGYQSPRRSLLLPDLRDALPHAPSADAIAPGGEVPALDQRLWSRLVANVVKAASGAEVAIVRQLPVRSRVIGPVSQLTLEGWLEVGDRLVQCTLTGKTLKALAAGPGADMLSFAGFDAEGQKVDGFALAEDELYRVTTTDAIARHAQYQAFFAGHSLLERWRGGPELPIWPAADGERLALRDVVLASLKRLKAAHGDAFSPPYLDAYAGLLADTGARVEPRWVFTLDDGQVLLNSYRNQGSGPYQQVRNTRVTTPDNFALGGKGRLSALYDADAVAWENRAKAIYKRATLRKDGAEVTQDTDDEVVLTSELRWKQWQGLPGLAAWKPTPFLNGGYTTEFNPDEAAGRLKPRRSELNTVGGVAWYPGYGLKEIRSGAVLKNDLANPGFLEPGWQVQATFERKLEALLPVTLKAGLDLVHYMETPTDTPDRLGWQGDLTLGVTVPLWERFSLSLVGDAFAYRGKLPTTSTWGSSFDLKVGLGYSLSFKPFYGVWF